MTTCIVWTSSGGKNSGGLCRILWTRRPKLFSSVAHLNRHHFSTHNPRDRFLTKPAGTSIARPVSDCTHRGWLDLGFRHVLGFGQLGGLSALPPTFRAEDLIFCQVFQLIQLGALAMHLSFALPRLPSSLVASHPRRSRSRFVPVL